MGARKFAFWSPDSKWQESLILQVKLQYFRYLMQRANSLEKTDAGKDWRQKEKEVAEDEMAR